MVSEKLRESDPESLGGSLGRVLERVRERLSDDDWAEHDERLAAAREAELARYRAAERVEACRRWADRGIPSRELRVVFGECEPQETRAMRSVRSGPTTVHPGAWPPVVIVLCGSLGCGKTTAACWWLVHGPRRPTFARASSPRFVSMAEIARRGRFEKDFFDSILRARMLVVDDMGAEYSDKNGSTLSDVDALLSTRISLELPLLITTNLSPEQFCERYGGRVASRMEGGGMFVDVSGPDLRGRGAA